MVTLEQHITELEAERSACSEPIGRLAIDAELTAARFQRDRAEASAQCDLQCTGNDPHRQSPEPIYSPFLGMVSRHPRPFARTHRPVWNAGQLAAELEQIALELHMAHSCGAGADAHLCIALHQLHRMQRDLLC